MDTVHASTKDTVEKYLSVVTFNTATLYKHLGLSSFKKGSYFSYCDEHLDAMQSSGVERLLDMCTIPLLHPPMGAPLFLYNITGLTLNDLNNLDPNTTARLEKKIDAFAVEYNAARPKTMDEV